MRIISIALVGLAALWSTPQTAQAKAVPDTTDVLMPPGANYDTAAFRLWYPATGKPVQGILLLVPGSNEDGRSMVDDPLWQAFATRHRLALVACYWTDKPHPLDFIEEYINVSKGSGQAFLDALTALAARSKHPEIAQAPLLLWGMSAGGEFNYEFTAWKPERVIAFVVNKGGIYYSALVSSAARAVPGLLFVGGKDLLFRTQTITGLFSVNRRAGALWALTEEPSADHRVGRSRALATTFFEDILPLRLDESSSGTPSRRPLKALTEQSGFLGDLTAKTVQPLGTGQVPNYPTAWLPTERVARAWRAVVTETPFDSSVVANPSAPPSAIPGIPNLPDVVTVVPFYTKPNETDAEKTKVIIPVEVDGRRGNVVIDLGDPDVDLNRTYLQPSLTGGVDTVTDANRIPDRVGDRPDSWDKVHVHLRIGTLQVADFDDPPIHTPAHPHANATLNHIFGNFSWVFAPRFGNIGLCVLEQFETIIDYPHQRLILIRLDAAGHRLAAVPAYTPKWTAPLIDMAQDAGYYGVQQFWGIAVRPDNTLDTANPANNTETHMMDTGAPDNDGKILGYPFLRQLGVVGFNHRTHQVILYQ